MKVGIGVSTFRRPNNLEKLLRSILANVAAPYEFVVGIDDEMDIESSGVCKSLGVNHFRAKNRGVAVNKNRLIKILYDRGCDYLYILEDDLIVIGDFTKVYNKAFDSLKIPMLVGLHPEIVETPNLNGNFKIVKTVEHGKLHLVYPSTCSNCFIAMTRPLIEACGYFNTVQYKNKYGRIQTMWLDMAKISYKTSGKPGSEWIERRMGWPDVQEGRNLYRYIGDTKGGLSEKDKKAELSIFRESYLKYNKRPLLNVPYSEEQIVIKPKAIDY